MALEADAAAGLNLPVFDLQTRQPSSFILCIMRLLFAVTCFSSFRSVLNYFTFVNAESAVLICRKEIAFDKNGWLEV
jgi:hypothetical protein